LLHISRFLDDRDTTSLQRLLSRVAQSTVSTHYIERKHMSNQHREMPGSGVLFWEDENMRRSDKAPDYKGFVLLEHDYKAGEKLKLGGWVKQTSVGKTLISLREDAWQKKQQMEKEPREEVPAYRKRKDDDLPF